jgi:hypothetical protein
MNKIFFVRTYLGLYLVFTSIFAIVGTSILLFVLVAAQSSVSIEAENANQISQNTTVISDSSASDGKAIRFDIDSVPTTEKRYVGVYFSGGNDALSLTYFGRPAEISSTYYQSNQINKLQTWERESIDRGTVSNITITSKDTNYISGIADGEPAAIAWLDYYVEELRKISEYSMSKDMPVFATLDHEWEVKVNQGILTGRNADPGVYAKALGILYQKLRLKAPNVTYTYWVGGSDHTKINNVMSAMTTAPMIIAVDPYVNGNRDENASQNWNRYLDKFRRSSGPLYMQYNRLKTLIPSSQSWDIKFAIGEHGYQTTSYIVDGITKIATNHTDSQIAAYYTNLRKHMVDSDVVYSIFFNSDRDTPYSITPGAVYPVPQAVVNFANNMYLSN